MAEIKSNPKFEVTVTMELTAQEVSALAALAGYGTDEFLKCFYTNMGKAYLEPHEEGLRTLFSAVGHYDEKMRVLHRNVMDAVNGKNNYHSGLTPKDFNVYL